jgi:hypothetical protein
MRDTTAAAGSAPAAQILESQVLESRVLPAPSGDAAMLQ